MRCCKETWDADLPSSLRNAKQACSVCSAIQAASKAEWHKAVQQHRKVTARWTPTQPNWISPLWKKQWEAWRHWPDLAFHRVDPPSATHHKRKGWKRHFTGLNLVTWTASWVDIRIQKLEITSTFRLYDKELAHVRHAISMCRIILECVKAHVVNIEQMIICGWWGFNLLFQINFPFSTLVLLPVSWYRQNVSWGQLSPESRLQIWLCVHKPPDASRQN